MTAAAGRNLYRGFEVVADLQEDPEQLGIHGVEATAAAAGEFVSEKQGFAV